MLKLTEEEIGQRLGNVQGWVRRDEKWIEKKFRFRTFMDAVDFVNEVAQISEKVKHHPLISIDYKMVTLKLTTWKSGGLTERDFQSVAKFDQVYHQY